MRGAGDDRGRVDPSALQAALAAWDAYERLGSPEGELVIAQIDASTTSATAATAAGSPSSKATAAALVIVAMAPMMRAR